MLEAAGFVLAGGRSRRMGAEKAQVLLRGEPLLAHALRTLRQAGELLCGNASDASSPSSPSELTARAGEDSTLPKAGLFPLSIAGARVPLEGFAPVVADAEADRGPLGGICAALAATEARRAVFLPVDLPLLPASLVAYLLVESMRREAAVTVASLKGFAQTFPAVVERTALPLLRAELEAGRGGCYKAFQAAAAGLGRPLLLLPVEEALEQGRVVHRAGLALESWFLNVNEPGDLARAEACLR
jgi:molybdopterin-guanine dinucleotide biosynthesis protein A